MNKILLVGATGLVGSHVLEQLLADPRCGEVVALTRRSLDASAPKLRNVVADFEQLPEAAEVWRVDAVICALGSTMHQAGSQAAFRRIDHDHPLQIARRARGQAAQAFALNSAKGADPASRFFYSRVKGELERDLRALDFPSLTLVRPGLIGGERTQPRRGEQLAARVLGMLHPLLPRGWRIDPAENIAAALVEAALAPRPGVQVVESAQLS